MAEITTRELGATAKGSPLTNAEVDTNFINLNQGIAAVPGEIGAVTEDMTGFVNRTGSTIAFNAGTRIFTLAPAVTSFDVYYKGIKYTITTTKTITITNTSGGRYIKYNQATGLLEEVFDHPTFAEDILVAYIAWDSVRSNAIVFGDERHGSNRDTVWHRHQHTNIGAIWRTGGVISYTLNSASAITIGLTAPLTLLDEDLTHTVTHSASPSAAYQQILDGVAQLPVVWKDGTSYRYDTPTTFPWKAPSTGGCVKYNSIVSDVGSAVDAASNKYVVYWIVLTNDSVYPVKSFMGTAEHSKLDDAYAETFSPSGFSLPELAVMYQIVLSTGSAVANTYKATIAAVRRVVSGTSYVSAFVPTSHNNLSDRELTNQHPIAAITNLQSTLDNKSNVGHGHTLDSVVTTQGLSTAEDKILFYDYSAGAHSYLAVGSGLYFDATTLKVNVASSSVSGIVAVSDAVDSTSSSVAASSFAVRAAYNLAAAAIPSSLLGAVSGVATLDGSGKVVSSQLPSFVDDVLEYANLASFPATGETAKIYVALDTNKVYRWSGSTYIEISASPGSTDAVTEGSTNLYFTNARALSATASAYQPIDADLTAIGALSGTSGFLRKTAANTWTLDTATYADTSTAQVLTNKDVATRVVTAPATTGTLTINGNDADLYVAEGLTGSVTFAVPSGTNVNGRKLIIRIKDSGTSRALTWQLSSSLAGGFRAVGVTLPTATVAGKTTYVGCIYNTASGGSWDVIAVTTEA